MQIFGLPLRSASHRPLDCGLGERKDYSYEKDYTRLRVNIQKKLSVSRKRAKTPSTPITADIDV